MIESSNFGITEDLEKFKKKFSLKIKLKYMT